MSVTIGNLMENGSKKIYMYLKNCTFWWIFLVNLRPLHGKSIYCKVVSEHIFVDGSAISGTPNYFENCRFQYNFKIWGWAGKGISVHKNHVLRPLYNWYLCHITIVKWSWINKKSIIKCIWDIFILSPFSTWRKRATEAQD